MLTEARTINILGTDVHVLFRKEAEDPKLKTCVGYYDASKSVIVVKILVPDENSMGDLDKYQFEILRHEILHAFLHESGLDCCSGSAENWATNEEMVDWFAIQSPKIFKILREQKLV